MNDRMKEILCGLHEITLGCRADMHEPDEQNLTATVVGTVLDNAMGCNIIEGLLQSGTHEIVIHLHRKSADGHNQRNERINLCDLIALARMAIGASEWDKLAKKDAATTEAVRVLRRGLEQWAGAWNGLTERHHLQCAVNLKDYINQALTALTGQEQAD